MYSPESPYHNISHIYETKPMKSNHWEPSPHSVEVKKAVGMISLMLCSESKQLRKTMFYSTLLSH